MIKELTQLERVEEELAAMNKNITEMDRAQFMEESGISRTLLSNYMNHKAYSLDRAMEMLIFFRKKIEEREKLINS